MKKNKKEKKENTKEEGEKMENIREEISIEIKNLENMIETEEDKKEIEKQRKILDELLEKYIKENV